MDLSALQQLLSALRGRRVVCVGDLMIDRFVYGDVRRVSPEAPIPVMARSHELLMLGAAGNVARNVAALGGEAALVGLVGGDADADEAVRLVAMESGIEELLVADVSRPTTLKTRFVSAGQQLLRVDLEETRPVDDEIARRLVSAVRRASKNASAILVSDYGKGVVTDSVIGACQEAGTVVIIDSKARNFQRYGAVDIIKPNAAELSFATALPTSTDAEIAIALVHALSLCEANAILVTRGAQGISLGVRGESVRHFPGAPREVFDASGAGDTTIAALGLALAAKVSIDEAIAFAMLASGVAVTKVGTAVITPDEMIEALLSAHSASVEAKIATRQRMLGEVARWRIKGLRVGFTNGCFDILHRGHVAYLNQARGWCDRLIVGLNSDRSVRALKGQGRPVNDLESRAMVLAGLACVDMIAPFDEDTPIDLIESIRPDVLIKGADYAEDEVVGGELVRSWGGKVQLAAIVDGYSTSAAIARMTASKAS
jgi:D-beta-D-heptose 7-phosphate kinase/D-beta-D-heptose 1-phosphate adenosyltransferase